MKDKLVKTHHKGAFFYFKKIGFCFSIFMGATICVAIPLSVATIIKNNEKNKEKDKDEAIKDDKEVSNKLLTFWNKFPLIIKKLSFFDSVFIYLISSE